MRKTVLAYVISKDDGNQIIEETHLIHEETLFDKIVMTKYVSGNAKLLKGNDIQSEYDIWINLIQNNWEYKIDNNTTVKISHNHHEIFDIFSIHLRDTKIDQIING